MTAHYLLCKTGFPSESVMERSVEVDACCMRAEMPRPRASVSPELPTRFAWARPWEMIVVLVLMLAALRAIAVMPAGAQPAVAGGTYLPFVTRSDLPALQSHWLRSLVIEPGENGRLIGLTSEGWLLASTDRGESWLPLPLPSGVAPSSISYTGMLGMDYNHPQSLYLGTGDAGLWHSTDGGHTWWQISTQRMTSVAVSLDDPATLWAGVQWPPTYADGIVRSDDWGNTWTSDGYGLFGHVRSPILIDPMRHDMHYVITQNISAWNNLERKVNGVWERVHNAPLALLIDLGAPRLGLALQGDPHSLYVGGPSGTLWVSHNTYAPSVADVTWELVAQFPDNYVTIPLAVGTGPEQGSLFVSVFQLSNDTGLTLRSDDGGSTWTPLTIPAPSAPER